VSVREPIEDGYGRATSRTMMRRVRARVLARVLARIPTSGTSGPIGADEMRRGPDGGLARRQLYTSIAYGADEAIEGREGVSLGGDALDERAVRLFFFRGPVMVLEGWSRAVESSSSSEQACCPSRAGLQVRVDGYSTPPRSGGMYGGAGSGCAMLSPGVLRAACCVTTACLTQGLADIFRWQVREKSPRSSSVASFTHKTSARSGKAPRLTEASAPCLVRPERVPRTATPRFHSCFIYKGTISLFAHTITMLLKQLTNIWNGTEARECLCCLSTPCV
jgi:hypothetical protein